MDLVVAALGAALVAIAPHPHPGPAGPVGRRAARLWRAHVHLWDAVLCRDPWDPAPARCRR